MKEKENFKITCIFNVIRKTTIDVVKIKNGADKFPS